MHLSSWDLITGRGDDLLVHRAHPHKPVTTGAFTGAVEFIKANIKPSRAWRKLLSRTSKKVRGNMARNMRQKGMPEHLHRGCVFSPLWHSSFLEPFFFIGYLISIAVLRSVSGNLHWANAGGAWDIITAKEKSSIVELKQKRKRRSLTPPSSATRWAIRFKGYFFGGS